MMQFLRKSAGLNSFVPAPKSHLRAKFWNTDFIYLFIYMVRNEEELITNMVSLN